MQGRGPQSRRAGQARSESERPRDRGCDAGRKEQKLIALNDISMASTRDDTHAEGYNGQAHAHSSAPACAPARAGASRRLGDEAERAQVDGNDERSVCDDDDDECERDGEHNERKAAGEGAVEGAEGRRGWRWDTMEESGRAL